MNKSLIRLLSVWVSLFSLRLFQCKICPSLTTIYNPMVDSGYVVRSFFKIPYTNILVVNTYLKHSEDSSVVYYNDLHSQTGEIINVIKPEYTIIEMSYIYQQNKILAMNFDRIVIANPYTLKNERFLSIPQLVHAQMIDKTIYAIATLKRYLINIINTDTMMVIRTLDNTKYSNVLNSYNFYTKFFTRPLPQTYIFITVNSYGFYSWSVDLSILDTKYNDYIGPTIVKNTDYLNRPFIKHPTKDIFFVGGANLEILAFEIVNIKTQTYRILMKLNLYNSYYNLNIENLVYKSSTAFSSNPLLIAGDGNKIYDLVLNFDDTNQIIIPTYQDPPFSTDYHNTSYKWYEMPDSLDSLLIMSANQFITFYNYYYHTYYYNFCFETDWQSRRFMYEGNGQSYYAIIKDKQVKYFNRSNIIQNYGNNSNILYEPYFEINNFYRVKNCEECLLIKTVENLTNNHFISSIVMYPMQNNFNYSLNISTLGFSWNEVNLNLDPFYFQNQIWIVFGFRNKTEEKKFLFTLINIYNPKQNVFLSGNTDEENERKSSFAIASVDDPDNPEIIGVDLLGYIYVWDFLSPKIMKYSRKSNYSCLNSDIGTVYQYNKKKWLIFVCDDMKVLCYDFQQNVTQYIMQLVANPLSLRAFPSAGILIIGETITGNAFIYKFKDGIFSYFLTIKTGSFIDRLISIELLKDNSIWVQYIYSNIFYSLGDCIENAEDCQNCSQTYYFNTQTGYELTFGNGSLSTPFINSQNFITAMLGVQRYQDHISGITGINVNIIVDPSFKLVLPKEFLNFFYSSIVKLTIKSKVENQFALLEYGDQLEFQNYNYVNLQDVQIRYYFIKRPYQCGISFYNITQNATLNNIYLYIYTPISTPLNCFQIYAYQTNIQILKLSIQNEDFSSHKSILSTLQTNWINIQNLSLNNCTFGDSFSILTQNSNLQASLKSISLTNNKCIQLPNQSVSSLFSAGLFNVEDLQIKNNNFCNKIIFSSVPSLEHLNYKFYFKQVQLFDNSFTARTSYLFFNSLYSMRQYPSHSATFLQMTIQNNSLKISKQDDLRQASLIQTSKIMSHQFENIIFKNHHEIGFSSIEYSNNVQIKQFDCINDKEYFDKSLNSTSGRCFQLYEILSTKIQTIRIIYKKTYNNELISLQNKLYNSLSDFDVIDGEFSNLMLMQFNISNFANPITIYSQNYLILTISNCRFYDNRLQIIKDSQTISTSALWIRNTLGKVKISNSTFKNSTSNSTYNFMFIETNQLELNNVDCNSSSFFGLFNNKSYGGFMNLKINNLKIVDSSFRKSKSQYGSFIFIKSYEQILKVTISNTTFSEGYAQTDGGALYFDIVKSQLYFTCLNCFFDNIYTYSSKSSAIGFQKYRITSNSLIHEMSCEGGRIQNIFGVGDSFFMDIQNTKLTLMNIKQIKSIINNSEISGIQINKQFDKIASQQSTLVNSEYSEINILGCYINNISILNPDSNLSLLINSQFTKIIISDSIIQNGIFVKSLIKVINGTLSLNNTQFKNIIQQKKFFTRYLSEDYSSSNDEISSLIIMRDSNLVISDKTLFLDTKCYNNCTGAVFYLMNTNFDITGMIISNSEAQYGGSLFILGLKHLNKINSSKFENNIAYVDGGSIYLQALKVDNFSLDIESCEFLLNNALSGDGGALFIRSKSQNSTNQLIKIKDTNFISNIAQIGGGINQKEISSKLLGNNTFKLNVGKKFGNDSLSYPSRLRLASMDQFLNKYKAENIGNDTLLITNFRSGDTLQSLEFELINDQDEIIIPINTQEIQEFAVRVRVRNNENFENYSIRKNNIAYYDINSKKFVFKEFDFIGIPGSQATLEFVSDQIYVLDKNKINQYNQDYTFKIIIYFRECISGEAIQKHNSLIECIICPEGKYSFNLQDCYICPTGATCSGGSQMIANQGYWRKASDSSEFISCSLFDNCKGGIFGNDICFEGHIGALCEECDISGSFWKKNYSKSAKNSCTNCDKISHNSWFVLLLTLWTLVSMALAIKGDNQISSQQGTYTFNIRNQFRQQTNSIQNPQNQISQTNNSEIFKSARAKNQSMVKSINSSRLFYSPKYEAKSINFRKISEKISPTKNLAQIKKSNKIICQEEERSGIYIKILTNYFQIVSSIATFNLSIPSGIFEFPQSVGSPLKSTLNSLDCVLKDYESSIPYIYLRLMFSLLIPVGYFFIFFIGLVVNKINNRKIRFPWYILFTAGMFLIIYVQPDLVAQMIALMSCRQIGDTKYILADVSYECYTSEHSKFVLLFISPLLSIWVLVLPLILFYMLYQNRNNLNRIKIKLRFGFLYKEYKKEAFYWEFIKMVEKICIILCLNFYSTNVIIKAILVFIIIVLYGILSIIIEPFEEQSINKLDVYSTNVCALTVIFGLFIYQNPYPYFYYPSLIIIIFINSIFILIIMKRIINSYIKKLVKMIEVILQKLALKDPKFKKYLRKQEDIKKVNPTVKVKVKKIFEDYMKMPFEEKQKIKVRILKSQFNQTLLNMFGDQEDTTDNYRNKKSISYKKKFLLINQSEEQSNLISYNSSNNRLIRPIQSLDYVNDEEETQQRRAFVRFTIFSEQNYADEIINKPSGFEQYRICIEDNKNDGTNSIDQSLKEFNSQQFQDQSIPNTFKEEQNNQEVR